MKVKYFFVVIAVLMNYKAYSEIIYYNSKVEINNLGNSIAIWEAYNSETERTSIMASYSTDGFSWGSPVTISQDCSMSSEPMIGIDSKGNVVAAWLFSDLETGDLSIHAAMYNVSSHQWLAYELIDSFVQREFSLKVNSKGKVLLQYTCISSEILALKLTTAVCGTSGWTSSVQIAP